MSTHPGTTSAAIEQGARAAGGDQPPGARVTIALIGNPNTGKTTLFNAISGLRHKTANFPGTTLEARLANVKAGVEGGRDGELIDLPGIYSLELEQIESRVCRDVLAGQAAPAGTPISSPGVVVVVVDAANLARNMALVGEVVRRRLPTVIAVNMVDVAARRGVTLDARALGEALGCEAVLTNARLGAGVVDLRHAIRRARIPAPVEAVPGDDDGLIAWAEAMAERAHVAAHAAPTPGGILARAEESQARAEEYAQRHASDETRSDKIDRVVLHPAWGLAVFALVMTGLFYSIFAIAAYPMDGIEWLFAQLGGLVEASMGEGILRDLLASGVVGGVAGTLVFLPQICLLFFLISILEDTGYLARAALLMDRMLRPFGLPGHAFVPLLSSHACALPGIMACRAIPDPKERLAAILVAPFMSCSARIPVYVLVTTLLFRDNPFMAALAFSGCYALGIVAGVVSALIARRTLLRGRARPMALELPSYKAPSLRTALVTTIDRGGVFLKKAGTNILAISIVLWWLSSYPHVGPPAEAAAIRAQAVEAQHESKPQEEIDALRRRADELENSHALAESYAGRLGRVVEPVFEPLGYDWRLSIGVVTSFAAREVFGTTMMVVLNEDEEADIADEGVFETIASAKRDDGVTPVFTRATSWSLLVYYVLAMQCLPTLAVTARESGSWKWAGVQLAWMCGVAYVAALITYQVLA